MADELTAAVRAEGPLDAATLVALQRFAGNSAIESLLGARVSVQRDPPDAGAGPAPAAAPPLDFNTLDMTAGTGVPTLEGVVTATPLGATSARIDAPKVKMDPVTLAIKSGLTLGPGKSILYGPVQSVVSSERVAQYKSPGAQPSDPPIEKKNVLGATLDQTYGIGTGGAMFGAAHPPFYVPPGTLSDVHTTDTLNIATGAGAGVLDQPGWPTPLTLGRDPFAPALVSTSGEDKFVTSFAAKYADGSSLFHMASTHWEVPWTITSLDAMGAGTGGAGTSGVALGTPPKTEGDIAVVAQGKSWISFPTVGDAMMVPAYTLLANLNPARDNDPTSYENTVQALFLKNPAFHVEVDCDTTFANVGKDTATVQVSGSRPGPSSTFELDKGDLGMVTFHLADVLDPASLKAGTGIGVTISLGTWLGSSASATRTWSFPYAKLVDHFPIKDGKYSLTAWLA
jgi:hypothetical protein